MECHSLSCLPQLVAHDSTVPKQSELITLNAYIQCSYGERTISYIESKICRTVRLLKDLPVTSVTVLQQCRNLRLERVKMRPKYACSDTQGIYVHVHVAIAYGQGKLKHTGKRHKALVLYLHNGGEILLETKNMQNLNSQT